ncbi:MULTISPECIES: hypothetical protein [Streptomyces]|uniref:hypothetical protein n=1 Tax=Streptomyces TaxID=1883 RepID=UPI00359CA06B
MGARGVEPDDLHDLAAPGVLRLDRVEGGNGGGVPDVRRTQVDDHLVRVGSVVEPMKPLGLTLDQMRDLLDATDRLDADAALGAEEREALLERVRAYQREAAAQVEKLRVQLSRAEDFEGTLRARLEQDAHTARG